jgi:anaerobic ribonucleoside-triphosphate reductase activating protein
MIKYFDRSIVMAEIPDEVTLALNITNCKLNCEGCSEPWLKPDTGTELTNEELMSLLLEYKDITCICFMGGDSDHKDVARCCDFIKEHSNLKTAIYSGFDFIDMDLAQHLDYYKIGHWIKPKGDSKEWWKTNCGPLQFPFSNQLLFEKVGNTLLNITYKFRVHPLNKLESYIIEQDNKENN